MSIDSFPSKLLDNAVNEFSKLPGIGKKTALRLVLHLLKQNKEDVALFSNSIQKLKEEVKQCKVCCNISDHEICSICSDKNRSGEIICVVENIKDVMAIEATSHFRGLYHVLGGIISPMDGIGPQDLNISSLLERLKQDDASEVILALSTTMEGETTSFYLYKKLKEFDLQISTIARGVAFGDDLEYTDEITLGKSILNRTPFENTINSNS
jgi:recombination protein RecR